MSPVTPGLYSPPFITETDEPSPWLDCTWSSGLMLANKATATATHPNGRYPGTRAEREALRAASGDRTGGSSLYDLRLGVVKRYRWTYSLLPITWSTLMARMKAGHGANVQGLYSKLPAHFQRWDPHFATLGSRSTHAMYIQGHDRPGYQHIDPKTGLLLDFYLCDPLGRGTYKGEWIPVGAIKAFTSGLGYFGVVTVAQGSK